MKDIIIVGAGGFGREILALIETLNGISQEWNVLGFLDDNPNALDRYDIKEKVIGSIQTWQPKGDEYYAMTIADPKIKLSVTGMLKERGARFATLIHPGALIGKRTTLGEGIIIMGFNGIDIDVTIKDFVFINSYCSIGHDTVIGECTTIAPGVGISGGCKIGKGVEIGGHAYLIPGRKIGDGATIAAGSVVFSNVKERTTVLGNPAKRMRAIED